MYGFFVDSYYWVLVVPAMLLAVWAQMRVQTTFSKYERVYSMRGMTAAMVTRQILDANGLQHVRVEWTQGRLSDHYDPRSNVIRLSEAVYNSTSIGAIGVAAHEAGHAMQYAQNYAPIKLRAMLIPITNIGSSLAVPLAIMGFALGMGWLIDVGIVLFLAVVLFQLVTLPVEFNASRRAIRTLDTYGYLNDGELKGAKKVLSAAALTYVAALVTAVANLARLLLLRNRERR